MKQTKLSFLFLVFVIDLLVMEYVVPSKRIVSKEDLDEFLVSDAYKEYIGYIERLNNSVKNMKIDSDVEISEVLIQNKKIKNSTRCKLLRILF